LPSWLTSGLAWTVIRLDAVSVWIDDEGGVVVEAVNRAKTGRTIVMPARAQRRRMKCIYGGGIRCRKAEVQTRAFVGLNGALRLRWNVIRSL
jgi:hypothetical protein